MKKMLSVILACFLISSCGGEGGSQEPPLKDGRVCAGVPAEVPQKTDVPFLSLNKIWTVVLGIGLTASVFINLALSWRLKKPRIILKEDLERAVRVLEKSYPKETFLLVDALNEDFVKINELEEQLKSANSI